MTWKGNTITDPSPLISSQLAATASSSLWESQLRAFEIAFFGGFHFDTILVSTSVIHKVGTIHFIYNFIPL